MLPLLVVYSVLVAVCSSDTAGDVPFPPGFKFGAATASYQVEGAWNSSDKGENIWDRFTHSNPAAIKDYTNGDLACDSYNQWQQDIQIAADLGLDFYRFSLSWSRLLPTGFPNVISEDGKRFYNNLIDGLLDKGIEPMITIYHWDLPQSIQDLGGWVNPYIVNWFGDYARVVYNLFGDRVKLWITINEPLIVCDLAYNSGIMAPGIISIPFGAYICNKNILLAHAKAWRIYDEEFKFKYHGEVSIANHFVWFEPVNQENTELAELTRQNCAGRYSHPIFSKEGGWPPSIEKVMEESSKKRGFPESTFPSFTQEEIEFVRGTFDFFAFNHYTSRLVRKAEAGETFGFWPLGDAEDLNAKMVQPDEWPQAASFWFRVFPQGIRRQLVWLKENYGDLRFVITENGYSTFGGLNDMDRVNYYRDYLEQVLLAIKEDGVNVTHYTAWTLIDNFEWLEGYSTKFGLYEVDFNDPKRTRTPRASARFYADIIKNHALPGKNTKSKASWLRQGVVLVSALIVITPLINIV